ncbi:MAG: LysR family transcriptional regulator [Acidimicrobiales bacterium]|nr:LysR family transcriptional regulator [Acidimicrobiales bacterium]
MAATRSRLPDISITQMEYLVAAQEATTWAKAASDLGVSQSALSQGLAELQRRLGIELFAWNGRKRIPTSAAQEVTEHARRILALTSDLSGWADQVRAGSAGKLRVGMIDAAAVDHFGETLKEFRENNPHLDLHITVGSSGQLLEDLLSGDLDLAVCVATDATTFMRVPLLEEALYIYAPPGTNASTPQNWGPWVTFPRGSVTRDLIESALRSAGAPFSVVAESNQPEVLSELVHIGMGWTVLPRMQAERPPASLIPIRKTPLLKRVLVATTRDSGLANPAASALISKLQQESAKVTQNKETTGT